MKVICGFNDVRIPWTGNHVLAVTASRGASLWRTVSSFVWSGLQTGGRQRQVHHVKHAAEAPGHLRKITKRFITLHRRDDCVNEAISNTEGRKHGMKQQLMRFLLSVQ